MPLDITHDKLDSIIGDAMERQDQFQCKAEPTPEETRKSLHELVDKAMDLGAKNIIFAADAPDGTFVAMIGKMSEIVHVNEKVQRQLLRAAVKTITDEPTGESRNG